MCTFLDYISLQQQYLPTDCQWPQWGDRPTSESFYHVLRIRKPCLFWKAPVTQWVMRLAGYSIMGAYLNLTKPILINYNQAKPDRNKQNQTNSNLQEIAIDWIPCLKMAGNLPPGTEQ